MFDPQLLICDRAHGIDASGIRKVFDLAASLKDPVNLSIGQPDFDVPEAVKESAINAIRLGMNRYTVTQGIRQLQDKIESRIAQQFPAWKPARQQGNYETLITSGVSGGLMLAILACVGPGDEVLIPDPFFVMYKHLVTLAGGKAVYVDTYPDFQITAARVEPLITKRTKMLLFNTPANPTGVVSRPDVCGEIAELGDRHGFLVVSDEIYDEFCYEKVTGPNHRNYCPSPAGSSTNVLLLRGFSKTYGMTGWRLGWAAGPKPIIEQMTKLQQYSFVCAPSMVQVAGVTALDQDMGAEIEEYRKKRDVVVSTLKESFNLTTPGGAFYAFPEVPPRLGLSASQFVEKAIARGLLIIPGNVFSRRDTHFRISYACAPTMLQRGLEILIDLAK